MTTPRLHRADCTARVAFVVLLAAAFAVGGCSKPPSRELQPGSYRAVLSVPGGKELPFGLDVAREETGPVLYLINGEERVRVTEVDAPPGRLTARMPGYETTLTATIAGGEAGGNRQVRARGGPRARIAVPGHARRDLAVPPGAAQRQRRRRRPLGRDLQRCARPARARHRGAGAALRAGHGHGRDAGRRPALPGRRGSRRAAATLAVRRRRRGAVRGQARRERQPGRRSVDRSRGEPAPRRERDPDADVDATAIATQLRNPEAGFEFAFKDLDGQTVELETTHGFGTRCCS